MKVKAIKSAEGLSLELPLEFCQKHGITNSSAYEIFHLRDGFFLISSDGMLPIIAKSALSSAPAFQSGIPTLEELLLLRKLSQIKFQERTPALVEKSLSEQERKILQSLEKKKLIYAFFGGKYAEGVYNIPDSVYPMLSKQSLAMPAATSTAAKAPSAALPKAPIGPLPAVDTYGHFEQTGFCIVQMEGDIRMMHDKLKDRISSGVVIGVRAFDKGLYLATKRFFSGCEQKIRPHLDSKGKSIEQFAKLAGIGEDAALVTLVILCDSGEAIEKRKGFYSTA